MDKITIKITEEVATIEEMADLLENIAGQIRDGMTSGFYPHWALGESDGT